MLHPRLKLQAIFSKLIVCAGLVIFQFAFPAVAQAQTAEWTGICVGNGSVSTNDSDVATISGLQCLIANILTVSLSGLGLTAFVMLVVGAMQWQLSGGNSQQVETARKTMTMAIVGIVVALSSFIILNLVANFTGIMELKTFKIPDSTVDWPAQ